MNVTINTDASFKKLKGKKYSGYAFYIICDAFKIKRYGNFKITPETPQQSELMCLGNALKSLLVTSKSKNLKFRYLTINTDCKSIIQGVTSTKDDYEINTNYINYDIVRELYHLIPAKYKNFKHVKAHDGVETHRKWVNNWCDKHSKIARINQENEYTRKS